VRYGRQAVQSPIPFGPALLEVPHERQQPGPATYRLTGIAHFETEHGPAKNATLLMYRSAIPPAPVESRKTQP
jgi:hypothetical protein